MARGYLKEKEYRLTDIKEYIRERMFVKKINQRDIARAIGVDPSTIVRRFKKMDFTIEELLIIFKLLDADQDKVGRLFILGGNK